VRVLVCVLILFHRECRQHNGRDERRDRRGGGDAVRREPEI
jgi:hypothetical protein